MLRSTNGSPGGTSTSTEYHEPGLAELRVATGVARLGVGATAGRGLEGVRRSPTRCCRSRRGRRHAAGGDDQVERRGGLLRGQADACAAYVDSHRRQDRRRGRAGRRPGPRQWPTPPAGMSTRSDGHRAPPRGQGQRDVRRGRRRSRCWSPAPSPWRARPGRRRPASAVTVPISSPEVTVAQPSSCRVSVNGSAARSEGEREVGVVPTRAACCSGTTSVTGSWADSPPGREASERGARSPSRRPRPRPTRPVRPVVPALVTSMVPVTVPPGSDRAGDRRQRRP